MAWGKLKSKYLDDISDLLSGLGIKDSSQRRYSNPDRLVAYLTTRTGERYDINFFMEGRFVVYESVVFEACTGNPEHETLLYQTMMGYNATIPLIGFALVDSKGTWEVILKGNQEYKNLDARSLHQIIEYYDLAWSKHVPRLKELSTELGLEFTGKLDNAIRSFIEGIID